MTNLLDDLKSGPPENPKQRLGKLADLLETHNIDLSEIGKIDKIKVWQGFHKDEAGETQIVDLAGVVISPSWETGPEWPVVEPGPAYRLPKAGVKPTASDQWESAVVLPDIQAGFYRAQDGTLVSTHDDQAIELAYSLIKAVRPSKVILVGDNLDLPDFSTKYVVTPAFQQTTQETINWTTRFCAQLRALAPEAEIVWLSGNHEERMPKWLAMNARAAFGLRRGLLSDEIPERWPVLSVPYLCRMEEFGIDYRPGYPAANVWITDRLKVIHGDKVKSNGSTAHMYLSREKVSVIYGHIHRREWAETTREDHDGSHTIMAASPGCLAKINGAVPSFHQGLDLDGRPIVRHENWQQGIAVVDYNTQDGRFNYNPVAFHREGSTLWAKYSGKEYKVTYE